jgi:hypothetical protein
MVIDELQPFDCSAQPLSRYALSRYGRTHTQVSSQSSQFLFIFQNETSLYLLFRVSTVRLGTVQYGRVTRGTGSGRVRGPAPLSENLLTECSRVSARGGGVAAPAAPSAAPHRTLPRHETADSARATGTLTRRRLSGSAVACRLSPVCPLSLSGDRVRCGAR